MGQTSLDYALIWGHYEIGNLLISYGGYFHGFCGPHLTSTSHLETCCSDGVRLLKCLISIETGQVPRGHDLRELFDRLSDATRARIQETWDDDICVHRKAEWDRCEAAIGDKIARDLPGALAAASKSFEKIRYSYEGDTGGLQYFLQDLPQLLGRVILELRPEYRAVRRMALSPVPGRS